LPPQLPGTWRTEITWKFGGVAVAPAADVLTLPAAPPFAPVPDPLPALVPAPVPAAPVTVTVPAPPPVPPPLPATTEPVGELGVTVPIAGGAPVPDVPMAVAGLPGAVLAVAGVIGCVEPTISTRELP